MRKLIRIVELKPRRSTWDFSESDKYWFDGSPVLSHFLNVYTLLVPENEKFYIRTLKSCMSQIPEQSQRSDLLRFFQQESLHGIAHKKCALHIGIGRRQADFFVRSTNFLLYSILEPLQPLKVRLSIVAAIEHINAIWAHFFLAGDILVKSDPEMRRLFYWHFAEEIEHKGVADSALKTICGSYFIRIAGGALTFVLFHFLLVVGLIYLLLCDKQILRIRNLRDIYSFCISRGFFIHSIKGMLRYFNYNFDPWDLDDYELSRSAIDQYSEVLILNESKSVAG